MSEVFEIHFILSAAESGAKIATPFSGKGAGGIAQLLHLLRARRES
jgi:hypothetical protein